MNITGSLIINDQIYSYLKSHLSGAFYVASDTRYGYDASSNDNKRAYKLSFDASRTWSGSTSDASNTSTGSTGTSTAEDKYPPFIKVTIWRCTSI